MPADGADVMAMLPRKPNTLNQCSFSLHLRRCLNIKPALGRHDAPPVLPAYTCRSSDRLSR